MFERCLLSTVAALALSASLGACPARAESEAALAGPAAEAAPDAVVFGPYATIRRANEVANYFRGLGYSAIVYHNGDGYYVKVW